MSRPVSFEHQEFSPLLGGVPASALDCLQTNLAVLADRAHGPGAHLALGGPLRFTPVWRPGAPEESSLRRRLVEADELLGLRVATRADGLGGADVRELVTPDKPLFVVADAYAMPWLPYAGRRHMEHTFLLLAAGDGHAVVDAYHNDTPWGAARPGAWRVGADLIDAVARGGATALTFTAGPPRRHDPVATLADNAEAMRAAVDRIDGYLANVRRRLDEADTIDWVVLDVWLLARSRSLHALWCQANAGVAAGEAVGQQAQAWLRHATQAYVAARRVQRGGVVPATLVDQLDRLLRADVALAERLAASSGAPTTPDVDLRAVVAGELAGVLGLPAGDLAGGSVLRELPGFNSFRLVEVIERVEARLGVEVDPDRITADGLRSLDGLCELFAPAPSRPAGALP